MSNINISSIVYKGKSNPTTSGAVALIKECIITASFAGDWYTESVAVPAISITSVVTVPCLTASLLL